MIIKTTALLLNSRKYKEKDKLLTFFTQDLGKVMALCKSSRTSLHRWGCSTEPPAFGFIQLYEKKGFYTLTEICTVESLLSSASSLESLLTYQFFAHILDHYIPYGNPQPELFQKAQSIFFQWKTKQEPSLYYLFQFLVYFLSLQGYAQSWEKCSHCGKTFESDSKNYIYSNFSEGVLCCKDCSSSYQGLLTIENAIRAILAKMFRNDPLDAKEYETFQSHWAQIDKIISTFFMQTIDQKYISFSQTHAFMHFDWPRVVKGSHHEM